MTLQLIVLLQLDVETEKPIYFITKHRTISSTSSEDLKEQLTYFFDEHYCPCNVVAGSDILRIYEGRDDDPHGLFRYVNHMTYAEIEEKLGRAVDDDQLVSIRFEELFEELLLNK